MRHFVGRTSLSVRVEHLGERRTRTSVVPLYLARVKYQRAGRQTFSECHRRTPPEMVNRTDAASGVAGAVAGHRQVALWRTRIVKLQSLIDRFLSGNVGDDQTGCVFPGGE